MATHTVGSFELMVLAALLHLGDNAYGVRIRQEIEKRSGNDVSIGAVYTTLARLEAKGRVTSRLGEPKQARGGRARRFYKLTGAGQRAFSETVRGLDGMLSGLAWSGAGDAT